MAEVRSVLGDVSNAENVPPFDMVKKTRQSHLVEDMVVETVGNIIGVSLML